jgi:flagellar motility protein MotE (MotC chaperone)
VTKTDFTVWGISLLLALGVGWSRYAKAKTRNKVVRELVSMDPEHRAKVLSRLNPQFAMEIRQELLDRYRINA